MSAGSVKRFFMSSNGLRMHTKSIHKQEFKYKCDICGKGYNNIGNFKEHVHQHHGTSTERKVLECDECGKSFKTKYGLKLHKKIHS